MHVHIHPEAYFTDTYINKIFMGNFHDILCPIPCYKLQLFNKRQNNLFCVLLIHETTKSTCSGHAPPPFHLMHWFNIQYYSVPWETLLLTPVYIPISVASHGPNTSTWEMHTNQIHLTDLKMFSARCHFNMPTPHHTKKTYAAFKFSLLA